MRRIVRHAIAPVALFLGAVAVAEEAPLTNANVVAMTVAGLPPAVVVAKVAASTQTDFDTSADELVSLTKAGVDASVLEAMVKAEAGLPVVAAGQGATLKVAASPAANVPSNFEGTPCERPGIYLDENGTLVDIDVTSIASSRSGSGILTSITYGLVPTRARAVVDGAHSRTRTAQREPTFWFCFEESQAGLSYLAAGAMNPREFRLVAFKVRERQDQRTFEIGRFAIWGGRSGPSPKELRDTSVDKVKPGVYRVRAQRLLPGEYGFYATGTAGFGVGFGLSTGVGIRIFPFGVDGA